MQSSGAQFLHDRNPSLHTTDEVTTVIDYLKTTGEAIPNEPADKIQAYLGFLTEHVNDGILTGDQASIDRQIEAHVIKAEDVPESYFELQQRIAREQGHGDVEITADMRSQLIEAAQADQRGSLEKWVEYLGGEDGGYPDWFKHYTWTAVTKLGVFDKEKAEFQKRSRGTTAAYPELNREALAYVYDALHKSKIVGEAVDAGANNEKLQSLLQSANFGKLYAHAVLEVTPDAEELKNETKGAWIKFNQTDDPRTARRLAGSLQGHGTGWCTAGESTAASQLSVGDFYVYYTRDEEGKDTVPRVAIRMQNGQVAEVRGVNTAQELEPVMADTAAAQLQDLPGGETYIQKAENMKRLTALEQKITAGITELTRDEVRFLYEFDHEIQGFGYERDPRIAQVRALRGEQDLPELQSLLMESLEQQLQTSQQGYVSVIHELNDMRRRRHRFEMADRTEFVTALRGKLTEWKQDGSMEWCARYMIENGGRVTLVATPNIVADNKEVMHLARNFGKQQPLDTYVYEDLYQLYSAAELSGQATDMGAIRFSLIPGGLDDRLYGTAEKQRALLRTAQVSQPNLKVPSVLDAITYWQTLRAQGDNLVGSGVFDKTYIRHFDLEPKSLDGWDYLPDSYVNDGGEANLDNSDAADDYHGRFALG